MSAEKPDRFYFKLTEAGQPLMMLMMNAEGAINRMGDGEHPAGKMAMGQVSPELFQALAAAIPEDLFEFSGRYTFPEPRGKLMNLLMEFSFRGEEKGFEFTYGADSEGPPEEMVALITYALDLTHDWYAEKTRKG